MTLSGPFTWGKEWGSVRARSLGICYGTSCGKRRGVGPVVSILPLSLQNLVRILTLNLPSLLECSERQIDHSRMGHTF